MTFITRLPIAHRGLHDGNQKIFENSMSAMRAAVEYGYAIELDVQLSGDGVAMVFHDATLDRLTSKTGLLKDFDAEELQCIKLGRTNDTIDTLEDVLLEVAGDVPVIIEMKGDGNAMDARALAKGVASDLDNYHGEAAVMSFEHDLLQAFAKTGSKRPLGLTAEGVGEKAFEQHRAALPLGIQFVSYAVKALPNAFVEEARAIHEMPVITWTVRTPEDVELTNSYADQMTFEGFLP